MPRPMLIPSFALTRCGAGRAHVLEPVLPLAGIGSPGERPEGPTNTDPYERPLFAERMGGSTAADGAACAGRQTATP